MTTVVMAVTTASISTSSPSPSPSHLRLKHCYYAKWRKRENLLNWVKEEKNGHCNKKYAKLLEASQQSGCELRCEL